MRAIREMAVGFVISLMTAHVAAREPMDLRGPAAPTPDPRQLLFPENSTQDAPAEEAPSPLTCFQDALAELVDRVAPAVVAIETDRSPTAMHDGPPHDPRSWTSTGSGVVIRPDGMILTSQHVLADALAIHVTLHDGRRIRARQFASDPRADLAVIQIAVDGLQTADLGDARNLRRGHVVLAMGNPLGLAGDGQAAVGMGIVSAIARPLPGAFGQEEDRYYGDMIQTSAAIQPGHSGGPLFDIEGRVVGILTAVSASQSGGEGIAFAVPIAARTRQVIERLLTGRSVEYGYIGVEVASQSRSVLPTAHDRSEHGVRVATVSPGSPAQRSGLREGDLIVRVGEQPVQTADEFIQVVGALEPGISVEMEVFRREDRRMVRVDVGRRPSASTGAPTAASISFRGAMLGTVDRSVLSHANLPDAAMVVLMVGDDTPAGRAGLSPGDIIVQIDGQPLSADAGYQLTQRTDECLLGLASGGSILIPAR